MTQDLQSSVPLAEEDKAGGWTKPLATGVLVLADGTFLEGEGFGAVGDAVAEVCFNTAMTGYQEILTDPSYAEQIVTFTFPHIGNVGVNDEDLETINPAARGQVRGLIVFAPVTDPSNHRSRAHFDAWLKARSIIGLSGVDTRALTTLIREKGMPNAVIAHSPDGIFDIEALAARAAAWPGIDGMDLVPPVTTLTPHEWTETGPIPARIAAPAHRNSYRVVAIDYGVKRSILQLLTEAGCAVTVVPATTSAEAIAALQPEGVFLSNGPGDPAETAHYAVPVIQDLLARKTPVFGICLGHQMLALAIGAKTHKMRQGHHGANHPVIDVTTGKVEIVSMNHGFAVDAATLPPNAVETHRSLFDGTNCGLKLTDRPAFSVQHHPEASPGPRDSHYLFQRFVTLMEERKS